MKKTYGKGLFGIRPYEETQSQEEITRRREKLEAKRAARRKEGHMMERIKKQEFLDYRRKLKMQHQKHLEQIRKEYEEEQRRKNSIFGMMKRKLSRFNFKRGGLNVKVSKKTPTKSKKTVKKSSKTSKESKKTVKKSKRRL